MATVATKPEPICPAETVTDPGRLTDAFVLASATTVLAVAAFDRLTLQFVDEPALTVEGEQLKEDTSVGAERFSVVVRDVPFNAAVI